MMTEKDLWEKPTNAYRGIPMWSWNGKLYSDLLKEWVLEAQRSIPG